MAEIVHTQEYDRWSFDPPMPVLDVAVSRPGSGAAAVEVEAIIDTGADGTLISRDLLDQIGAPFVDQAYLLGVMGTRQAVDLYLVTVRVASLTFPGLRVAALPAGGMTILGRDVLNQLHLGLVGVATTTEVLV
jgi:predicted aspartyl protease